MFGEDAQRFLHVALLRVEQHHYHDVVQQHNTDCVHNVFFLICLRNSMHLLEGGDRLQDSFLVALPDFKRWWRSKSPELVDQAVLAALEPGFLHRLDSSFANTDTVPNME